MKNCFTEFSWAFDTLCNFVMICSAARFFSLSPSNPFCANVSADIKHKLRASRDITREIQGNSLCNKIMAKERREKKQLNADEKWYFACKQQHRTKTNRNKFSIFDEKSESGRTKNVRNKYLNVNSCFTWNTERAETQMQTNDCKCKMLHLLRSIRTRIKWNTMAYSYLLKIARIVNYFPFS